MFSALMNAQTTVSGTITDADGPLPGVNVVLKGTTNGTTADFDGNYSISNIPTNGILVFSSIGYTTKEVSVNGQTQINVTLDAATDTLDEVIVVGYGSMERSNVTGAISTVDVAAIENTPVPNVVEALRGQVAGLRVTRGGGQPGSGVNFTIRGVNSLGGQAAEGNPNRPIIVVDGVPIPEGNLSELNSDDIESVNVIKDAGAGAIYGSSAANGVVLITTKSGSVGKPTITVNASSSINEVASRVNIMNGDEYIKYLFDSGQGTTVDGVLDANETINYINGNQVDWQNELLKQGIVNNLSLAVSGGTEKIRFYLSGDLYKEEGIVVNSDYNRYSFRFNGDYSPSDKVKIGARVQLTKSFADETANAINDFPDGNGGFAPFIPIFNNTPLGDIRDADGNFTKFVRDDRFQINPFFRYDESVVDRFITRSYVNPYVEIGILDGLKYTLNTFAEERSQFYGRFTSSDFRDGDPSTAQIQKQNSTNYLVDNIINFKKDYGKHGIDATFVYGFQKNEFEQIDAFSDQLATDLLGYNGIDDTSTENQRFSWDTDESGRVYYVGRIGYDYDNKYVVTLTMRRDGSSKFGPSTRFGNFPSASVAWNAHNESFWNEDAALNSLKFRASYGTLGNDRITNYGYLGTPSVIRSTILIDPDPDNDPLEPDLVPQNIVGYAKNTLANPYLRWETSKQLNLGVDFGLFNNRLNGSIDVYKIDTGEILLPEFIPVVNGYESYISNVGVTTNKGIDVALRGNIIQNEDFTWNAAVNWATDRNEVVSLNRANLDSNGQPRDDEANGWFIGEPIGAIYSYQFEGIWQADEAAEAAAFNQVPGDAKYLDVNGDGEITPGEDRFVIGTPNPDWYGGITNTFTYKGLELSVLLEAVQGVTVVNNFYGGYNGRNNQVAIDYWTPERPSNTFPRVGSQDWNGERGEAVRARDASFVSLRNVSLTYNMPNKFLDNTPFKAVSFYVRGNNLKYFTDLEDAYSPEAGFGQYPIVRTWTFGSSITF
ncbi:SusC/RagA family TonB-linked outer membrane protein [Urechidicola croceus]|uniref:TonB-dependent receptor plug domain-containing protein n=1 Tax=Urechidicola croceus TaxID=1850246 RepID=A0A1D8P7M1_9FLAO|nr:TonB-dependent receptor [Urechidicola croceus]AOW20560.1 hypothetical protein LPB138_07650 [Urechidicola croceus]